MLNDFFKQVCVLGAGGKMGSGIALLLLQEMARIEAESTGEIGNGNFRLVLVDSNDKGLNEVAKIMKKHLIKYGEKNINSLRRFFFSNKKLISNLEFIEYFVEGALRIVRFETEGPSAKNSLLVFEAIVENVETKVEVFSRLAKQLPSEALYLTNTSSIPIHLLNEKAGLNNRIIGFHFYNPPLIQKLVELIIPCSTDSKVTTMAKELVKRLNKIAVFSNDIAGFIGNGHFIREAIYACEKVEELAQAYSLPQALYIMNRVTQDFLIRPMGIFQLIDYVGIDVFYKICKIMSTYLPNELFQNTLIDKMIEMKVLGGQNADGSQKNGFFQYKGHARVGIYSPYEHKYHSLADEAWSTLVGQMQLDIYSWKTLQHDPMALEKLKAYFLKIKQNPALGAELARNYLRRSRNIAQKLVQTNVARSMEDIDIILKEGFYHLYGFKDIELN